jgi:oligopeptide/dipeptide ABC transporter ATP-binding protein
LICTLLLLTACTSNQSTQNAANSDSTTATPAAKTGGTLIWARYGDADSLDPHRTTTTRIVYQNPRHSYTIGLLQSILRLGAQRQTRLKAIEGLPPNLINYPKGCPFAPRCQFAIAQCHDEDPL